MEQRTQPLGNAADADQNIVMMNVYSLGVEKDVKYEMPATMENIVGFIHQFGGEAVHTLFCDMEGKVLLSTLGPGIHRVPDRTFAPLLKRWLNAIQTGEKKVEPLELNEGEEILCEIPYFRANSHTAASAHRLAAYLVQKYEGLSSSTNADRTSTAIDKRKGEGL